MRRHAFDQFEVLKLNPINHNPQWEEFIRVSSELGFKVRVTGGVSLTHEINCTRADFIEVLDLMWS